MLKGQQKIIDKFGKFGTNSIDDFDDERYVNNGWWWYSQEPFGDRSNNNCHVFHEDTLAELYKAIARTAKESNWEGIWNETHCCLCGKELDEYGNNPDPIPFDEDWFTKKRYYKCCDDCNFNKVMPVRMTHIYGDK